MVIELYDDVNTDALTFGVKMALHDHPYFATRLVKEGVMYYWDENDAEPVIEEIPILSAFNYGHCADHYFPFKVTYCGNNICFNCSHELTDGSGLFIFISTVMEYYARYIHGDMNYIPEKTSREERLADEAALPSEIAGRKDADPLGKIKNYTSSKFDPDRMSEEISCEKITIDKAKLRSTSFSFDASPFALVSPVLSRACLPYLTDDNRIVELSIPLSLRKIFNVESLHNFVGTNEFYYFDTIMKDMSYEQIATIFRARLDLLSDRDGIEEGWNKIVQMKPLLSTAEGRAKIMRGLFGGFYDANIVYTHITQTNISDMAGEYIKSIYSMIYKMNPFITCVGVNFKNDITLTISSKFSDDGFYKNICNELDKLDIHYTREKITLGGMRFFEYDES